MQVLSAGFIGALQHDGGWMSLSVLSPIFIYLIDVVV